MAKESLAGSTALFLNEWKKNLLIFLNVGSSIYSKMFFGCVVISDLFLLQGTVLSNPWLVF